MSELSGDGWYPLPRVTAVGVSVAVGGDVIVRA